MSLKRASCVLYPRMPEPSSLTLGPDTDLEMYSVCPHFPTEDALSGLLPGWPPVYWGPPG